VVTSGLHGEKLGFAARVTELTAWPNPVTRVTSLEDLNREEGSPEQLYLRAAYLLHFWRDSEDDSPVVRSAAEWALRQYNEARARRPNFEAAHFNAGTCYWMLGKRPEAIAALKRTLELAPDNLAARLTLADLYLEGKQVTEAEAAVRAVLALRPSLAPAHRRLAGCYRFRKQWAAAESELRAAVTEDPTDPRSTLELGRLLTATGRRDAALLELRKVKELAPDDAETLLALGKAYSEVKQYQEAVDTLDAAVKLRSKWADAQYALALASLGLGDLDRARRAYEVLERLKSPLAHKLEARLQR
jgi:tetratricopeptide (TPR) repeat protein